MRVDLLIANGEVVTSRETFRADIAVRAGRILAVGDLQGVEASEVYDARGTYVLPGLIDEHVHSRDPGLTYKEDFAHSTRSAAAGGITTLLEMPNSVPPVHNAATFASRVSEITPKAHVDFGLYGMVLGDFNTEELVGLAEAGVVGFKLFWGYALNPRTLELVYNFRKTDDVIMPPDERQIYDAFSQIAQTGRAVAVHAEHAGIISDLATREAATGADDYASFLRSRPPFTEALTVQMGIIIAGAAGAHLHVLHVTAAEAVDVIAAARAKGQPVTGETCPHYLSLTDADYPRLGVEMKIYPPIREQSHQDRLWRGVRDNELQAIGSDHGPATVEEKTGSIWTVIAGACGVQSIVPAMLASVSQGKLTLNRLVELMSENPARIFGLYGKKGTITPGADADFTIIDMNREMTFRREEMYSKHHVTLFDGARIQGAPVASFVRGRQIMAEGKPIGEPQGRLVRPTAPSQAFW